MRTTLTSDRWPLAGPPVAHDCWAWTPRRLSDLPAIRRDVRTALADRHRGLPAEQAEELHEQLVLLLDELLSNALRHGAAPVVGTVGRTPAAWLLTVSDAAGQVPPHPALDRDPALGGLGLRMVADLSIGFGWCTDGRQKRVWALLAVR